MRGRWLVAVLLTVCMMLAGCGQANSSVPEDNSGSPGQTKAGTKDTDSKDTTEDSGINTESQEESVVVNGYPAFDFERKTVTLNSGYGMPILGLGMFSLSDSEAENSTYWALKAGFRLIDTARIYGNEAAVGRGLQRAIDEGIIEDYDVWDFELTEDEMEQMTALERDERFADY